MDALESTGCLEESLPVGCLCALEQCLDLGFKDQVTGSAVL